MFALFKSIFSGYKKALIKNENLDRWNWLLCKYQQSLICWLSQKHLSQVFTEFIRIRQELQQKIRHIEKNLYLKRVCYSGRLLVKNIKKTFFSYDEEIFPKRLILYMDVLGAKQIISKKEEEQEKFQKLKKLLERFYELNANGKGTSEIEMTTFSDHFVLSCPLNYRPDGSICNVDHFFSVAMRLHLEGLNSGLLLRGSIVKGELFHENDLIVGRALLDAEKNERKARFPRVIIENSITQKTWSYFKKNFLTQDKCGTFYINYLDESLFQDYGGELDLKNVFEMIKANVERYRNTDKKILEKWEWMERNYKPSKISHQ